MTSISIKRSLSSSSFGNGNCNRSTYTPISCKCCKRVLVKQENEPRTLIGPAKKIKLEYDRQIIKQERPESSASYSSKPLVKKGGQKIVLNNETYLKRSESANSSLINSGHRGGQKIVLDNDNGNFKRQGKSLSTSDNYSCNQSLDQTIKNNFKKPQNFHFNRGFRFGPYNNYKDGNSWNQSYNRNRGNFKRNWRPNNQNFKRNNYYNQMNKSNRGPYKESSDYNDCDRPNSRSSCHSSNSSFSNKSNLVLPFIPPESSQVQLENIRLNASFKDPNISKKLKISNSNNNVNNARSSMLGVKSSEASTSKTQAYTPLVNSTHDSDDKDEVNDEVVVPLKAICSSCITSSKPEDSGDDDIEILFNSCTIQVCSEEGSGIGRTRNNRTSSSCAQTSEVFDVIDEDSNDDENEDELINLIGINSTSVINALQTKQVLCSNNKSDDQMLVENEIEEIGEDIEVGDSNRETFVQDIDNKEDESLINEVGEEMGSTDDNISKEMGTVVSSVYDEDETANIPTLLSMEKATDQQIMDEVRIEGCSGDSRTNIDSDHVEIISGKKNAATENREEDKPKLNQEMNEEHNLGNIQVNIEQEKHVSYCDNEENEEYIYEDANSMQYIVDENEEYTKDVEDENEVNNKDVVNEVQVDGHEHYTNDADIEHENHTNDANDEVQVNQNDECAAVVDDEIQVIDENVKFLNKGETDLEFFSGSEKQDNEGIITQSVGEEHVNKNDVEIELQSLDQNVACANNQENVANSENEECIYEIENETVEPNVQNDVRSITKNDDILGDDEIQTIENETTNKRENITTQKALNENNEISGHAQRDEQISVVQRNEFRDVVSKKNVSCISDETKCLLTASEQNDIQMIEEESSNDASETPVDDLVPVENEFQHEKECEEIIDITEAEECVVKSRKTSRRAPSNTQYQSSINSEFNIETEASNSDNRCTTTTKNLRKSSRLQSTPVKEYVPLLESETTPVSLTPIRRSRRLQSNISFSKCLPTITEDSSQKNFGQPSTNLDNEISLIEPPQEEKSKLLSLRSRSRSSNAIVTPIRTSRRLNQKSEQECSVNEDTIDEKFKSEVHTDSAAATVSSPCDEEDEDGVVCID